MESAPDRRTWDALQRGSGQFAELVVRARSKAHRLYSPLLLRQPQQFLFLLSHMRARTTLLSHILGSSPEIGCYVEQQLSYRRPDQLNRLHRAYVTQTGSFAPRRYLLDKVLHNHLEVAPPVQALPTTHFLIMLRPPEPTIASIIKMRPVETAESAGDYYLQRLDGLVQLAESLRAVGKPFLYIDAEDLVDAAESTLGRIGRFLTLRQPLTENYAIGTYTGKRVYGDPSENIFSGKIVRNKEERSGVRFPEELAAVWRERYQATRTELLRLGAEKSGAADLK